MPAFRQPIQGLCALLAIIHLMDDTHATIAKLLNLYGEASNAAPQDIEKLSIHKAERFGLTHIYSFAYNGAKYYVSDDYSLNDEPRLVELVIRDINHTLQGHLLKNPTPQSDGAMYASGLDGVEYYLWKCSDGIEGSKLVH